MEEGVGGAGRGGGKVVHKRDGSKILVLEWREKDLFCVLLCANFLKITSNMICKIS